jgi:hypothetical protein
MNRNWVPPHDDLVSTYKQIRTFKQWLTDISIDTCCRIICNTSNSMQWISSLNVCIIIDRFGVKKRDGINDSNPDKSTSNCKGPSIQQPSLTREQLLKKLGLPPPLVLDSNRQHPIFDDDKVILVGLNHENLHWSFLCYVVRTGLIIHFDSIHQANQRCFKRVVYHFTKLGIFKSSDKYCEMSFIKQKDTWECGYFIILSCYMLMKVDTIQTRFKKKRKHSDIDTGDEGYEGDELSIIQQFVSPHQIRDTIGHRFFSDEEYWRCDITNPCWMWILSRLKNYIDSTET